MVYNNSFILWPGACTLIMTRLLVSFKLVSVGFSFDYRSSLIINSKIEQQKALSAQSRNLFFINFFFLFGTRPQRKPAFEIHSISPKRRQDQISWSFVEPEIL